MNDTPRRSSSPPLRSSDEQRRGDPGKTFTRGHAYLLLGVAVWNVVTFGQFARNLWSAYDAGEDRATGYWVAHTVLIVVNFAIAAVLGRLGLKALRSTTGGRENSVP